ncbi:RelA/SpoT domain-containing protein [Paenibacillus sp. FSL H7-0737]|uniref:GTP pyrophosphokinase n=1 Tax=Paenibacillus sp. FSL H7-0737 TaxID=1536775 RepID=UPI000693B8C7|nr:RelA/SpoT domain-containing protein [Paenibacillus sp. FSL H7-0737]
MSIQKNVDDLKEWYHQKQPIYSNLASKIESIIKELFKAEGVTYYSISSRVKDLDSFIKKAQKEKYHDPINQIQDLAGIRVITYVRKEVIKSCDIIKPLFKIDETNSVDKSSELGKDKVGYRSVHYIATLTDERLALPEYKMFKNLVFEIQVRTLLEHAWADISHDRSYKFKGDFPPEYDIERRFALASATLELVDREFDSIVTTLDKYENETEEKTKRGELDLPINATSVNNYLLHTLAKYIEMGKVEPSFNGAEANVIDELLDFDLSNLGELDLLISRFLKEAPMIFERTNFVGLLRNLMMLTDTDKYFNKAWNQHWASIDAGFLQIASDYGIDMGDYIENNQIDIYVDEEYGYYIDHEDI